jgi:pyruvate,water dikinase
VIVLDAEGRPAELPSSMVAAQPESAASQAGRSAAGPSAGSTAGAQTTGAQIVGGGRRLTGAGVSSGRARGTARVIRHPSEGARLQPGDILVAPSTDPGWTPLFLRASAVVMEVGGYLSHGAIVAREYGLPAVVNVAGALTAIEDGQTLAVDGDTGEVLIPPE